MPRSRGDATFKYVCASVRSHATTEVVHIHDWHQIVLPVDGARLVDFSRTGGRTEGEQGVLVPRGQPHRFRMLGENHFIVLDMPCEGHRAQGLPDAVWRHAAAEPFFPLDEGLRRLASYVAYELAGDAYDVVAAHHINSLVIHALTHRLAGRRRPAAICRALDLIHAHYAEPLTVAELAAAAGLSVSAFHKRFRAAMGRAPVDYLIEVRIDQAARLICASELSIAEVALAVGFSDQSTLTRSMSRRRGKTPARLRVQARMPAIG